MTRSEDNVRGRTPGSLEIGKFPWGNTSRAEGPSYEQRFSFYTGAVDRFLQELPEGYLSAGLAQERMKSFLPIRHSLLLPLDRNASLRSLKSRKMEPRPLTGLSADSERRADFEASYITPITEVLRANGISRHVLALVGDNARASPIPVLTKTRPIENAGLNVLVPLERERHFGPLSRVLEQDIPWSRKSSRLIWRGAFTGPDPGAKYRRGNTRTAILDVAQRNVNNSEIDVGITLVPTARRHDPSVALTGESIKSELTIPEQLSSKFLLSLEGNDVASGLKWKMFSQSCVLMPAPSVDSWFCESFLEPFVHYVPVSPDLSDLEEMLEWCRSNDAASQAIAHNGAAFARSFMSEAIETELFYSVVRWYATHPRLQDFLDNSAQLVHESAKAMTHRARRKRLRQILSVRAMLRKIRKLVNPPG